MPQPEVRRLHVDGHLRNVMLNIRIADLVLGSDVFEGEVIRGLGRAQKGGGVMWNEAGLPTFLEILPRIAYQVRFRDECPLKVDEITDGRSHANGVPP